MILGHRHSVPIRLTLDTNHLGGRWPLFLADHRITEVYGHNLDASQYKDYVLTLLFVKYVSDKYAGKPHALIEVPEGGGFDDMVALKATCGRPKN